jgi:hypothetical protein
MTSDYCGKHPVWPQFIAESTQYDLSLLGKAPSITSVYCGKHSVWPQFIAESAQYDLSLLRKALSMTSVYCGKHPVWPQFIAESTQYDLSLLRKALSMTSVYCGKHHRNVFCYHFRNEFASSLFTLLSYFSLNLNKLLTRLLIKNLSN